MSKSKLVNRIYFVIKKCWLYILGLAALIWFLVRVIPKPSRAAYPCQRAAFPIASAFVLWVSGVISTSVLFRKAKAKFAEARYAIAGVLLILCAISSILIITPGNFNLFAANPGSDDDDFIPIDAPNDPMGEGRGIFPGRVVWSYDTASTSWSGEEGFWWSDSYIDTLTVNYMLSRGILALTEASNDSIAWDSVFRYFNRIHDKGDIGYSENEKIAIKLNMNMIKIQDQESNAITIAPQVVLALLKQLVYKANVPASAITFYDISRFVPDFIFDRCKEEFPDVHFIDNSMGENGRELFSMDINTVIHWSDTAVQGQDSYIPSFVTTADYIINLGSLKAHKLAGITICAKNHFGTYASNAQGTSGPMDAGVHPFIAATDNLPRFGTKRDMGTYNSLVDLMGHKDLGEKTLLFLVDALYNSPYHNTTVEADCMLEMPPFNGDWMSSIFLSFDGVAIESVGLDFLSSETGPVGEWINGNVDNYLHEAALAYDPPSGTIYDPEGDGTPLNSLGVHEHWNDHINKQYARNLGEDEGIDLYYVDALSGATYVDTTIIDTTVIDTTVIDTTTTDTSAVGIGRSVFSLDLPELLIYPNPVNDYASLLLNTKILGEINIELYTVNGKRTATYHFNKDQILQNFKIDLSDQSPGSYICTVYGTGFTKSIQLVKVK
ncbi:DUF362 domain-containing protein [Bacteroidota bacterium]